MRLKLYQIDAFTTQVFKGNPAAVCPLETWLEDSLLQEIAAENNLSETAFFVREGGSYRLRWFTPTTEVDLCGHATLASAFVLKVELGIIDEPLIFVTRSGELRVNQIQNRFTLDFPLHSPQRCSAPSGLYQALGIEGTEVLIAQDFIVVVESESQVRKLKPYFPKLLGLPGRGVCVTAPGDDYDFVSRWFGPNVGVDEDPVTGSAHCALAPYWAGRLKKSSLRAAQVSTRGGEILCQVEGQRVFLTGAAVKYLSGEIYLPA